MSEVYNYEYYHNCCGPIAYEDPPHWIEFFGKVADQIVRDIHPASVLDAGCAMGYLVAALRDRGVDAYGIDISEYAISMVRDDVKPFCVVGSLTEPLPKSLPQRFDLVVTIEVLEHLNENDGKKAIGNLCTLTDRIIFSSTPDDYTERTHVNVQQREYWARCFAQQMFFDDIFYRPKYITGYAVCYRRRREWLEQVGVYEKFIRTQDEYIETELNATKNKAGIVSTVFWNTIDGYNEECSEKILTEISEKTNAAVTISGEIVIPAGCNKIRIDPCEGRYCTVDGIKLVKNGIKLYPKPLNGYIIDDTFFFPTEDPQMEAELPDGGGSVLHIDMTLRLFDVRDLTLDTVRRRLESDRRETEALSARLEESRREMAEREQAHSEQIANMEQAHSEQKAKMEQACAKEVEEQREAYEAQLEEKDESLDQKDKYIGEIVALCNERQAKIESLTATVNALQSANQQLSSRCSAAEQNYAVVSNAFFWKITKPARAAVDGVKKLAKANPHVYMALKTAKTTLRYGPKKSRAIMSAYKAELARANAVATWPTEAELKQQRETEFDRQVKFSILVPLYNTPLNFLSEMIESVQAQTYANWELCLADGSDAAHADVGNACRKYARKDKRVKYRKLEKNLGISGNTNACIEMATGDYIALFDHDDLLHPSALFEVMKAICEKKADFIYTDENTFHDTPKDAYCPNFKPDFAPDTLRSYNYICHLSVFSSKLLRQAGGGFRPECDGSQDYDLILRLTEQAKTIVHIPKILYYWRSHAASTAADISAKPYTLTAAKRALADHLERVGLKGEVEDSRIPSTYRIQYAIAQKDLISIIIPNKDHIDDLDKCITSIREKSTYENWEIIVIENNSTEKETFDYYRQIEGDSRIRVVRFSGPFNYSAINNFGATYAKGRYLLLLNNDIEVITPDWMEQMLMFAQRKDVGAVGAMLYYPDDTVQHAGVIMGIGGVAGHAHKYYPRNDYGYMSRMSIVQNLSAVTAACMMIPMKVWREVQGLDEKYAVAFNDVDLCMRIRKANYLIVWTPYAELYHYESKSRGLEDTKEKQERFGREIMRFKEKWYKELAAGDPYYNPNLTLDREDFSVRA